MSSHHNRSATTASRHSCSSLFLMYTRLCTLIIPREMWNMEIMHTCATTQSWQWSLERKYQRSCKEPFLYSLHPLMTAEAQKKQRCRGDQLYFYSGDFCRFVPVFLFLLWSFKTLQSNYTQYPISKVFIPFKNFLKLN